MLSPLLKKTPAVRLDRPLVIGHRGASGLAPENTLAAFRLATRLGADGVELDVHLSAEGIPIVIHDKRVNRTTNSGGAVSRRTMQELQSLDAGTWFERRLARRPRTRAMTRRLTASSFAGEPLPTLADALSLFESTALERIYIELKGSVATRELLLDRVLSLVHRSPLHRSVTLLSFDHAIIRRAKEIDGAIRTAATFPVRGRRLVSTRSIVRVAEDARVDEVALHFGLVTRRRVDALHERGIAVSVWTVNSKLGMRRVTACGVDSIMTNFPDRLREVLDGSPHRRVKGFRERLRDRR
jgi:glycerophosphoryl diester phosphodiesterase